MPRKKGEQKIALFRKKKRIEQKNQDFFDKSAAVQLLANTHLLLSSLVVGLAGRLIAYSKKVPARILRLLMRDWVR